MVLEEMKIQTLLLKIVVVLKCGSGTSFAQFGGGVQFGCGVEFGNTQLRQSLICRRAKFADSAQFGGDHQGGFHGRGKGLNQDGVQNIPEREREVMYLRSYAGLRGSGCSKVNSNFMPVEIFQPMTNPTLQGQGPTNSKFGLVAGLISVTQPTCTPKEDMIGLHLGSEVIVLGESQS